MKKLTTIILTCFIFLFPLVIMAQPSDMEEIEQVIIKSYINGLINAHDFIKAKEGIHNEFRILGHSDSLLISKSRDEWISQRSKKKNLPDVQYNIVYIDITGNAASAKIEMQRSNIKAVDYLFLYKFRNKWKIVTAIDHVEKIN